MRPVPPASTARWIALAVAIVLVDQAVKALMLATFRPGDELVLLPVLSIVLTFNKGAAFSFLAGQDGWQRWFFAAVALAAAAFIVWLLRRGGSRLYLAGLALILGGAIGNLIDRLWLGQVVDFVLAHWRGWTFPAFNVADSAITIGAGLLILDSFRQRHADAPAAP
ncbi:MAG TPA: signal peptidase II [Casimicrobiaceae bacterium]|nr:signal peptidase II [Casimicrobiaceae bacterium]